MSKRHKQQGARPRSIVDLPFKSILDATPKDGQFVLVAWQKAGYSGYNSLYWDIENPLCQTTVAWMTIAQTHVFTKACGLQLRVNKKRMPVLKWHEHYSIVENDKYISKSTLPKVAETI